MVKQSSRKTESSRRVNPFTMRILIGFIVLFLGLACAHCGTAYPYTSSTASPSTTGGASATGSTTGTAPAPAPVAGTTTGSAATTSGGTTAGGATTGTANTGGTATAGTTTAGTSAGGTSAGTTTAGNPNVGNPNVPLTLTVNGQVPQSGGTRFGGGGGGGGGDLAAGRLVTMLGTVQGGVQKTTVANDGTFTLTFSNALTPNTMYAVAVFIDRNHNNTCDDQDTRWIVSIPGSTADVTVTVDGNTQQDAGACAAF